MKTITIEELEQLTPGSVTIVDVRPADTYQRGTFEGAINVPMKEFVDRYEEIPKDKSVWVLCHTGERSLDYVELLCSHGYDAGNITGGYRAYLRLQLERFMKEEDARKEKTKEIERSLIKKFRKSLWRSFTRAIQKYDLIQEGDKIAVCISGGKVNRYSSFCKYCWYCHSVLIRDIVCLSVFDIDFDFSCLCVFSCFNF